MSTQDQDRALVERLQRVANSDYVHAGTWGEAQPSDVTHLLEQAAAALTRLTRELAEAQKAEPLHQEGCPYQPWAESYDDPPEGIVCTCPESTLAARWKARWLIERCDVARLTQDAAKIMARIGIESDESASEAVERTMAAADAKIARLTRELAEAQAAAQRQYDQAVEATRRALVAEDAAREDYADALRCVSAGMHH